MRRYFFAVSSDQLVFDGVRRFRADSCLGRTLRSAQLDLVAEKLLFKSWWPQFFIPRALRGMPKSPDLVLWLTGTNEQSIVKHCASIEAFKSSGLIEVGLATGTTVLTRKVVAVLVVRVIQTHA